MEQVYNLYIASYSGKVKLYWNRILGAWVEFKSGASPIKESELRMAMKNAKNRAFGYIQSEKVEEPALELPCGATSKDSYDGPLDAWESVHGDAITANLKAAAAVRKPEDQPSGGSARWLADATDCVVDNQPIGGGERHWSSITGSSDPMDSPTFDEECDAGIHQ